MSGPLMRYLSPSHLEQLRESALTDESIALADLETEKDYLRVVEVLNWATPKRNAKNPEGDWLLFPHYEPGAGEPYAYAVRPDHPRLDKKRKKPVKYESPKLDDPLVYFPPRARQSDRYRREGLKVWTEGQKKALLLDQLAYTCIGLSGIWNAHNTAQRKNTGEYHLHPLIQRYVRIEGCEHIICFDYEARERTRDDIMRAAKTLGRILKDAGAASVRLAVPPAAKGHEKLGIDDFYTLVEREGERGAEAVQRLFVKAPEIDLSTLDTRPRIVVGADVYRTCDEASTVLLLMPHVYYRGPQLVRVVRSIEIEQRDGITRPADTPTIDTLPVESIWEDLTRYARVVKLVKTETGELEEEPTPPPMPVVRALAKRAQWPGLRELVRVVDAPLVRPNGDVVLSSGYDAETRTLVVLSPEIEAIELPEKPAQADARAAAVKLLGVVNDFPFEGQEDRAAWLACVLTTIARSVFSGPAPLFVVDAPVFGSGKTLLAKVAAIIATGRDPGESGYAHDDAEMSKRITSIALQGDAVVVLDNVIGPLGNASLGRALTADSWHERKLGGNESPTLPLLTTWIATANHAVLSGDMRRRVVPIRLVPMVERPDHRTGFRIPRLVEHVHAYRAELLADALTVLRAYLLAGRPAQRVGALGSYEGWIGIVASAVMYATGVSPLATRAEIDSAGSDSVLEAQRALMTRMLEVQRGKPSGLRAKDILREVDREVLDQLIMLERGEEMRAQHVGKALERLAKRTVDLDGMRHQIQGRIKNHAQLWRIVEVTDPSQQEGSAGSAGSSYTESLAKQDANYTCDTYIDRRWETPRTSRTPLPDHPGLHKVEPDWASFFVEHPAELERQAALVPANSNGTRPRGKATTGPHWAAYYKAHPEELARDAEAARQEAAQ